MIRLARALNRTGQLKSARRQDRFSYLEAFTSSAGDVVGVRVSLALSVVLSSVMLLLSQGSMAILQGADASVSLDPHHSWDLVLGMTKSTRDSALDNVLVYSNDGTALSYPVEVEGGDSAAQPNVLLGTPNTGQLPPGVDYAWYTNFCFGSLLIMVAEDEGGSRSTLYEYDSDLMLVEEHAIPFVPEYASNLWNGYSFVYYAGRLALVLADEHNVWMINKRPPNTYESNSDSVTYTSSLTISNATIVGSPAVTEGDFDNGSMVIVPTDVGLMAFDINLTISELSGLILGISLGGIRWVAEYSAEGHEFTPASGDRMMTFQYPHMPTTEIGKECVVVVSDDSRVVAYDRETGEVAWVEQVGLESVSGLEIDGIHPSPDCILATGYDGSRGYVIALDPATGDVRGGGTAYGDTDGRISGSPEYIIGRMCYLMFTETDRIYVYDYLFESRFVYDLSVVGLSCAPRYLGNVYLNVASAGNYIGVVTNAPELEVYPFIDYTGSSGDELDDGLDDGSDEVSNGTRTDDSWLYPLFAFCATMAALVVFVIMYKSRKNTRI
jgi:hypothetical protein